MEEYSKGSVEDKQRVEEREQDKEVKEEDSSSSNSSSDTEEKLVSDSVELSQDVEPSSVQKWGDPELDAEETEDNISPSLELNKEPEQFAELLTDVASKETMLPCSDETNDSTVDGVVADQAASENDGVVADQAASENDGVVADQAASENDGVVADQAASENDGVVADQAASENNSGNSSGFPELESKDKVEDLLQAANVSILETKPDIHESMENQPIMPLHPRVVQPTSWKSCCGLLEVLRRSDR